MLNLVAKDFLIQKKSFIIAILYGIFIFSVFGLGGGGLATAAYIMGTVAVSHIFTQTTCAVDDKNNTEIILNSLPINRKEIVSSKYISSFLFSLINLIIMAGIGFLFSRIFGGRVRLISLADIVIALFSTWLLISCYLSLYFRYGYLKTKMFNMFMFFIFFFGPSTLITWITEHPQHPVSGTANRLLTDYSPEILGGGLLGLGMILFFISMVISFGFYQAKDL